ncbi:MAG: polysaccharide pyruvyl transferase family protein [Pseudomonadota bacterium]|nr:polysaccharide pyruvyl transferase family protein [Pseudomonadota bacterium]
MRILVFNLHYSPNLGDGLIGACMVHALGELVPDATVVPIDISGRECFGAVTVRNRATLLKILRLFSKTLRRQIVYRRLNVMLDGVEPRWRAALEGADLAIIGGGQLFSDADLNFPAKLGRVAVLLRESGLPCAIHGTGVSRNWTRKGRALFRRLNEADLRAIGMRDEESLRAWEDQSGLFAPKALLTRDPGLLAFETFGPVAAIDRIALGVTSPLLLTYHADSGVAGSGGLGWFEKLALEIVEQVGPVRLFCNGADEDALALADLTARPAIRQAIESGGIEVAKVPQKPEDLVSIVAPCRAVISHRLHACILGYAYTRPVVGMGWDRKVQSFFASVGLDRFFVGRTKTDPGEVAARVKAALDQGIDPDTHRCAIEETREGMRTTLEALQGAERFKVRERA